MVSRTSARCMTDLRAVAGERVFVGPVEVSGEPLHLLGRERRERPFHLNDDQAVVRVGADSDRRELLLGGHWPRPPITSEVPSRSTREGRGPGGCNRAGPTWVKSRT